MKILKWILIILGAIIVGLGVVGGLGYKYYQDNSRAVCVACGEEKKQALVVKNGEGISSVAQRLAEAGMIRSVPVFRLLYKFNPSKALLYEGVFDIMNTQTPQEIIETLTSPPQQIAVTFLPGWRREEFASYLAELELPEFSEEEFLDLTAGLEGQLWADTYYIFRTASAEEIVELLGRTFANKTADLREEVPSGRTWEEILVIASILQRESRKPEEMKIIAGIIENRLEIEMLLQFCATAQYASGFDQASESWWLEPTLLDTQIVSPYNTYTTVGLPPTPIAAPSMAAIEAALHPEKSDYFFYLHGSDGQIHYGETVEQHNANKVYL